MSFGYKNSKKQGDAGLGSAIAWFTRHGYTVCIPLTDSQEYDLVIETAEGLKKVQVKTSGYKDKYGRYRVGLRTIGGYKGKGVVKKLDANVVDLLYILTSDGQQYLIPCSYIKAKSILNITSLLDIFKLNQ